MNDIDIEEGRRLNEAMKTEDPEWPMAAYRLAVWMQTNAAAMFDAIETGRQWETIARQLAASLDISDVCGPRPDIGRLRDESRGALAAFRHVADRTPTPTDGAS